MTGQISPEKRREAWRTKRVFYVTPQILTNDISRQACDAKTIVCLVVDEAHRALGNYAYCTVVKAIASATRHFRILALSATPGCASLFPPPPTFPVDLGARPDASSLPSQHGAGAARHPQSAHLEPGGAHVGGHRRAGLHSQHQAGDGAAVAHARAQRRAQPVHRAPQDPSR